MRLKTPIFLSLIVGALCIIIFLIWPGIQEILVKNQELKERQAVVASINEKNANMTKLIASLEDAQNFKHKEFVFNYIPMERREETIFNSLNAIASSGEVNVLLGDASLNIKKEKASSVVPEDPRSSQEVIFGSGVDTNGEDAPSVVLPSKKTISAEMLVFGSYDNIKKFVGQLYALDMLKTISVMNLTSVKDDKGVSTENISANITADFGYIPEAKINNNYSSPVFDRSSFNFALVNQVDELLSRKASFVTTEGLGRSNPFLP